MSKCFIYLLPALIIVGSIFIFEKTFSQANQKDSVTAMADNNAAYVKGMTRGRARALVGAGIGLISIIIGWRAKARSAKGANVRTSAIVALVLGIIGAVLSALHLSISMGAAFGSGGGKAGSILGIVFGLIGTVLGGSVLRRNNERNKL